MSCNKKTLSLSKINSLIANLRAKNYQVYTQPNRLNIIGVRNPLSNATKFDDYIYVIYKNDNNNWVGYRYNATTDPSSKYLQKGGYDSSTQGTAILPEGQYVDKYSIRLHANKYKAVAQKYGEDICVYRDYNRDNILNFDVSTKTCGSYGINIHRAKPDGADDGQGNTLEIGDYSAGCQVFQNFYCFQEFMQLAERQKDLYGNSFTYTLLDKSLRNKFILKRTILLGALLGGGFLIFLGIKKLKK